MANPTGKNQYSGGRSPSAEVSSARKQYAKSPAEFATISRNLRNQGFTRRDTIKRATHEARMIDALKAHGKY